MITEKLDVLCRRYFGAESYEVNRLPQSGSSRQYYRMRSGDRSCIGVVGDDIAENEAFIYLTGHFLAQGIAVPQIYAVADDSSCYIIQDLGDVQLFDCLDDMRLIARTIQTLPSIQFRGVGDIDFGRCYPVAEFDRRSVMWDLNYFKYCFMKPSGIECDESALEDDFQSFADCLTDEADSADWGFMYRDFQSRNVMIVNDAPCFIDYQGGRRGPCQYDLASFLWQARAAFSPDFRERMVDTYIEELKKYRPVDVDAFKGRLRKFVLFRLVQVLGAYGFRGLIQKKVHFVLSIPNALRSLQYELNNGITDDYPVLHSVLQRLCSLDKYKVEAQSGLTVHVNSFGFRKSGIPIDMTGNGGGFVFDCRSLPNPGRLDEYKPLTGRDEAVVDYLEQYDEVETFWSRASAMVGDAVARYADRGFTDLTVSFGCTGGRHRSVYMAERLTQYLTSKFGVRVLLNHTEQGIKEIRG